MPTSRPSKPRTPGLAVVFATALIALAPAPTAAQTGSAPGSPPPKSSTGASGDAPGISDPKSAEPAPPKKDAAPAFVPSETVSSGKPVSFPTDI